MVIYESGVACAGLMYRLPTVAGPGRTLLCSANSQDSLSVLEWEDTVVRLRLDKGAVGPLSDYPGASFQRVVLHWVIDEVGRGSKPWGTSAERVAFLTEVRRLISPGGAVVGCAANFLDLSFSRRSASLGSTSSHYERLLTRSGFARTKTYIVLPSAHDPRILVSTAPRASEHYFRMDMARASSDGRGIKPLARRILIRAGLNRHLQGSLLFVGYAPC